MYASTDPRTTEQKTADQSALNAALGLREPAPLIPADTRCANPTCRHAADEHSRRGCLVHVKPSEFCSCTEFAVESLSDAPVLAIADHDDILTTLPADLLKAALRIALVQVADTDDDEWAAYGEDVDREALERSLRSVLDVLA